MQLLNTETAIVFISKYIICAPSECNSKFHQKPFTFVLPTNTMEQTSREENACSESHKFSLFLWYPKVHSRFYKIFPLVSNLSITDYVRIISQTFKIHSNIILVSTLIYTKWLHYFSLTHKSPPPCTSLHHTHYMPCA